MQVTLKELGVQYKVSQTERNFNALYAKISPGLKIYIKRFVKDSDEADDIFSKVISILYNDIHKFDPSKGNISTWLYRIAYVTCMYHWRARKKENKISLSNFNSDEDNGLEDRLFAQFSTENTFMVEEDKKEIDEETKQEHEKVMLALSRLPKLEKEILLERWMNDSKYEEISDKFNIPLHSVKNKISRGKKKFHAIYNEQNQENA